MRPDYCFVISAETAHNGFLEIRGPEFSQEDTPPTLVVFENEMRLAEYIPGRFSYEGRTPDLTTSKNQNFIPETRLLLLLL